MSNLAEAAMRAAMFVRHLPVGQLASLKRMMREPLETIVPVDSAYYQVLDRIGQEDDLLPQDATRRSKAETKWALLVSLMAFAPESTTQDGSIGTELARVEYTETRLARFLRTDVNAPGFAREVRDVVTRLKTKGRRINWGDLAIILLSEDPAEVARKRREIARDYYRAVQL